MTPPATAGTTINGEKTNAATVASNNIFFISFKKLVFIGNLAGDCRIRPPPRPGGYKERWPLTGLSSGEKRRRAAAVQDAGAKGRARHSVRAVVVNPNAFVGKRRRAEVCPPTRAKRLGVSTDPAMSQLQVVIRDRAERGAGVVGDIWGGTDNCVTPPPATATLRI